MLNETLNRPVNEKKIFKHYYVEYILFLVSLKKNGIHKMYGIIIIYHEISKKEKDLNFSLVLVSFLSNGVLLYFYFENENQDTHQVKVNSRID
jgi:ABC-type Mn2+/Zn2+ transport system permease subunit